MYEIWLQYNLDVTTNIPETNHVRMGLSAGVSEEQLTTIEALSMIFIVVGAVPSIVLILFAGPLTLVAVGVAVLGGTLVVIGLCGIVFSWAVKYERNQGSAPDG